MSTDVFPDVQHVPVRLDESSRVQRPGQVEHLLSRSHLPGEVECLGRLHAPIGRVQWGVRVRDSVHDIGAAHSAGTRGDVGTRPRRLDPRLQSHVHAVNLGRIVFWCVVFRNLFARPARCGGRYFDLGDVIDLSQACLADQPARGELRIVTWGAHRRGDHLTAHDDRQGCFYDHTVDPIDSIHHRSRRRFVVLGKCDVGKPNRRPRTRRLAHR